VTGRPTLVEIQNIYLRRRERGERKERWLTGKIEEDGREERKIKKKDTDRNGENFFLLA
jgi:hypothetical protein